MILIISLFLLLLFIFLKGFEFSLFLYFDFLICYFLPIDIIYKLFLFILIIVVLKFFSLFFTKRKIHFDMYFGIPGSGKTTMAAYLARNVFKRKKCNNVYSNVAIKGAYKISKSDIGTYLISNGLLELDESDLYFGNREHKSNFAPGQLEVFKLHRHLKLDVVCFSQGWDECDKKLRTLTTRLFLLEPTIFPFFIKRRRISKKIGIDKETNELKDKYKFCFFSSYYIFSPTLWKMFNTEEHPQYCYKEFEKY